MTVRFKLIMLLIAVILTANSVLCLVGVHYVGRIWLEQIQDHVLANLGTAVASYQNQVQRIQDLLEVTSLDDSLVRPCARIEFGPCAQSLGRFGCRSPGLSDSA